MSDFGDFEPDDAFDPDDPQAEPVARFILAAEAFLTKDADRPTTLEELHPWERALRVYIAARLLQRLRDEGALE